jgi:teichuronic acid exporter
MSLGDSIRHGAAWLFLGSTGNRILNFAFGIVLARLLAPEVFGMLVSIQIFTGLLGFVAGGGMGQALVRAKEASKEDYDIVFTLQLIIGCVIYAGFFTVAPWFAIWYKTPLYADLLRVSALSFLLRPFVNLPGSILFRQMRFKTQTRINLTTLCVSGAVSIGMAYLGFGVWSLVLGGLVGALLGAVLLMPVTGWRPGLSFQWWRGRDIARYGVLVTIGDFIVYLRDQGSNFVLSRTLGAHSLGLFNKAKSFALIPQSVTGSVYQVTFRSLAKEQDNLDTSQYLYLRAVTLVAVYTWPAFLALAWLALPLVRFLYGDKWVGAAYPLTCFAVIGPFVMLDMLAGSVLAARNWLHREIPVQVAMLIIVVLGSVAGLPYGLVGVVIGASLSNVYGAVHMSWLAGRCLSIPMRRIAAALWTPLLLNVPVFLLWGTMDHAFALREQFSDLFYLLIMLCSGGLLFALLFFLAPLPSIASEQQRWRDFLTKDLLRIVKGWA